MNATRTAPARSALALLALAATTPVLAHHSVAMFDMTKVITLNGTVREFQWTNPHCFIQLAVPNGASSEEWSLEMASPGTLFRLGWKKASVRPGDRIAVVIHPMRDGGKGGALVSAKMADGRPVGTGS